MGDVSPCVLNMHDSHIENNSSSSFRVEHLWHVKLELDYSSVAAQWKMTQFDLLLWWTAPF
jgi:hypothetical protein